MFDRSMSDQVKYLHTATVERHGGPKLVSSKELPALTGFRSVFGYPPETAHVIVSQDSTRNLLKRSVYTDELLVDFDDAYEAAEELRELLVSGGIAFTRYDSGNRSVHFHISVMPMRGPTVPQSQRSWIHANAPLADVTVYRHSSLFRLDGTVHTKTGKKKVLLETVKGKRLKIEVTTPTKVVDVTPRTSTMQLERAINIPRAQGGRTVHAWTICNYARKAGFNEDEAYSMLSQWNSRKAAPPLREEVLWKKLSEAYGQDLI